MTPLEITYLTSKVYFVLSSLVFIVALVGYSAIIMLLAKLNAFTPFC